MLAAAPERSGLIVAMGDEDGLGNHVDGVTIRNNIFVANNFAGIAIGANVRNTKIYHNTFYQNGRQGVTIYDELSVLGVDIANNLFDQSANANCHANCTWYQTAHVQKGARAQNVTIANNFYAPAPPIVLGTTDSAPTSGAPGFVDAAAGNYRLAAGSAAIDKGKALAAVARDFDGRARPQGSVPDPGAFEYGTGGGSGGGGGGATLSVTPANAAAGSSVTVAWSGIAGAAPTNWIGLYTPGAASTAHNGNWMYVSCTKTATDARAGGSCSFALPGNLATGLYEMRLHAAASWTAIATAALSVSGSAPQPLSLSVAPLSANAGSSVTVTWGGIAAAAPTNWIGLYTPGAPSTAHNGNWMYVSCTQSAALARSSGSCMFPLPGNLTAGIYQLRLHAPASWTTIATSNPLTVSGATPQPLTLSVNASAASRGASVTVSWSGIVGAAPTNWIGLYPPGAAAQAHNGNWMYVSCTKTASVTRASGSCAFPLPATLSPGNYELRLHAPASWSAIATSSALTVQ
jgi:parallel beta-helix repeat protein